MIDLVPLAGFAAIPSGDDPLEVEGYVERLMNLSELVSESRDAIRFLVSHRTLQVLYENALYPFVQHLRRMLSQGNIPYYSAEDINKILHGIFANSSVFEDECGIVDVLSREEVFIPAVCAPDMPASIASDSSRLVLSIALRNEGAHPRRSVAGMPSVVTSVRAKAVIDYIEGSMVLPSKPYNIDCDVPTAGTLQGLLNQIDIPMLLANAADIDDMYSLFKLAIFRDMLRLDPERALSDIPNFSLRRQFLDSIEHLSFRSRPRAEKLIRAVIEIVLQRNLDNGHSLRVNKAGGSPPQMRGSDVAWRHYIDDEFRIHLWKCSSGPEFVKVVVHGNVTIDR